MNNQKLISELTRLYLPAGAVAPEALAQQIAGQTTVPVKLADHEGKVRAIVIPFDKTGSGDDAQHWTRLCTVANALQADLGFPPPAVSISGANQFGLWLSLETAIPAAQAQEFLGLLRQAYFPEVENAAVQETIELPPFLNPHTGKWAAFIHPGLGASFAEDGGLEMAPPLAGQVGFLDGLESLSLKQFAHGVDVLRKSLGDAVASTAPAPAPYAGADNLLLKDATLEDIVRYLHSKNIEPTFRHLVTKQLK